MKISIFALKYTLRVNLYVVFLFVGNVTLHLLQYVILSTLVANLSILKIITEGIP